MMHTPLFKFRTVVAQMLFTLLMVPAAWGESTPAVTSLIAQPAPSVCRDQYNRLVSNIETFNTNCGGKKDCIQNALKCGGDNTDTASSWSRGSSDEDQCSSIAEACNLSKGDAESIRQQLDEAREEKNDAVKDMRDLRKDASSSARENNQDRNTATKDAAEKAQQLEEKRVEAERAFREALTQIDAKKAEGIANAQKAYDDINTEYIKIRADLRQREANIQKFEDDRNAQCAASAENEALAREELLNQAEQKELEAYGKGYRRLYSVKGVAGAKRLRSQTKRQKVLVRYNNFLRKCLDGLYDPGKSLKQAANSSRIDLVAENQKAKDIEAVLESKRKQILDGLKQMAESTDKAKAEALLQKQEELMSIQKQQQLAAMQQQQEMIAMVTGQQSISKDSGTELADAGERVEEAQAKVENLRTQLKCGTGGKSDSSLERNGQISSSVSAVQATCASSDSICGQDEPKTVAAIGALCRGFQNANTSESATSTSGSTAAPARTGSSGSSRSAR